MEYRIYLYGATYSSKAVVIQIVWYCCDGGAYERGYAESLSQLNSL